MLYAASSTSRPSATLFLEKMKIKCPKCSKVLVVPTNLAGQRVKCPCGHELKTTTTQTPTRSPDSMGGKWIAANPSAGAKPIATNSGIASPPPSRSTPPPIRHAHSKNQTTHTQQVLKANVSGVRRCGRCKSEIHPQAKVCPHCKLWQNPNEYAATFCSIWVVLMIICFGFGFVVFVLLMLAVFGGMFGVMQTL